MDSDAVALLQPSSLTGILLRVRSHAACTERRVLL